jgi:hypothetical protein
MLRVAVVSHVDGCAPAGRHNRPAGGARAAILRVKIVFVTRCVVSCGTAAGSGAGLAALAVSLPAPYA